MGNIILKTRMSDNVVINQGVGGSIIATDDVDGAQHQKVKIEFGDDNVATQVSHTNPLPSTTREKPDSTSIYSPDNSTSTVYEASRIAKAAPGVLYSICGYNSSVVTQFIQLHNKATLPANGSVPAVILSVPAMSNFCYSSDKFGRFFSVGIIVCNSSTGPTKTIGTADCWFDIQYN